MGAHTFVALFAGINVGGNRTVAMADLRSMLEELGFERISTYVQSGNAVFRADGCPAQLAAAIEQAFGRRFGFFSRVMVRDICWLKRVVAENPWAEASGDPTKLHAYALERGPDEDDWQGLPAETAAASGSTSWGTCYICSRRSGYGRSKLAAAVPATLRVACTARNWRTVSKLLAMAEAADGSNS